MRNNSQESCRYNKNKRFKFNNFFPENRARKETLWKHIVQPDRPQMTVWRVRIACWITNTKNTHSEHVTHFFSTPENVT
jgi:hypothetical protein